MSISVLLVEDDEVFRIGLTVALKHATSIQLLGVAETGQQAVEMAARLQPDMVLMDLGLPVMTGVQATQHIKRQNPQMRVLALTSHSEARIVDEILNAGVDGFCLKGVSPERLMTVIESVYEGHFWVDAHISSQIRQKLSSSPPGVSRTNANESTQTSLHLLTDREQEVLQLISQGKKNQDIAELLCISPGTVRVHVHAILSKLEVSDRTQAALYLVNRQTLK